MVSGNNFTRFKNMHVLLIFCFLVPCIFGKPLPHARSRSCGVNKYGFGWRSEPYIVGGRTAIPNFWPWQVSLQSDGQHICGGTIINDRYILTAAHCISEANAAAYAWRAVVGKHSLEWTEASEQTYYVSKITKHEKFTPSHSNFNDIALMRLSTRLDFTQDVKPICLPETNEIPTGYGIVTGWGASYEGGPMTNYLQEVQLPLISKATCQARYPGEDISDAMICAGFDGTGGKDACQGDSGGPLVQKRGDHWVQIGIISWGYGSASPYAPSVYTRVDAYLNWIAANMN